MYPTLRTIHLLCGALSLPLLLMYSVSAVQMAHSGWFRMKPAVNEIDLRLEPENTDGRAVAREVMTRRNIRGEIASIQTPAGKLAIRVVVPGTVHEISYDGATGATRVKTSVAGIMGMLNRLHHTAGLWHEYAPLRWWGLLVAVVSLATIGMAATGIWMWWMRKQERRLGLVLLAANLLFSVSVLWMLRAAAP